MEKEVILKCTKMCKSFGPTKALVDVDLVVNRGEIRGLIGENGSGKSTISSIVAGVLPYDSGNIEFLGRPHKPADMLEAQQAGISMVVQEAGTIQNLTVMANIFVGKEERFSRGLFLDKKAMKKEAQQILDEIGASHIRADDSIMRYNFEDRKLVEIARALYEKPELLIVDETTTALPHKGREVLYRLMKKQAKENRAVLFISHDMDELMDNCNAITVLRDGRLIATLNEDEMSIPKMRSLMIGREISDEYYRTDLDGSFGEEVVLKAEHLSAGEILEDFSFELHKGEILGIGGLSDCGMHDLGKAVYGAVKLLTGKVIYKDGTEIKSPAAAVSKKMGYVSKNRDIESLILSSSITSNVALPSLNKLQKGIHLSAKDEEALTNEQIKEMSIKCENGAQTVDNLSGGNKQKVVFGKWIGNKAEILILDCPTRGIDIGTKVAMYKLMYRLKQEGRSIIMISEEIPELIGMSDRIIVIRDGKLSGILERSDTLNEHSVIECML
ncbi:sugar ABC transporter ATP-binding protein [Murimonas intestini]|uniref:sugar ABC transporter ATP-binding protein n=1 Tax=Murimonas intestini TaxID=1337051 RepID=UPI0011DDE543|nr:sugar ABC transporter ATP-binding protein [Murimonas intestini]